MDREFMKEPSYYRLFCKACKCGTGKQFLDQLKLKGHQWAYWFEYTAAQSGASWRTAAAIREAAAFFQEIGVAGF